MARDSFAPWKEFVPGVWTRLFVVALGIAVLVFGRRMVYGIVGFIALVLIFLLSAVPSICGYYFWLCEWRSRRKSVEGN
jgi:hypothetical protein